LALSIVRQGQHTVRFPDALYALFRPPAPLLPAPVRSFRHLSVAWRLKAPNNRLLQQLHHDNYSRLFTFNFMNVEKFSEHRMHDAVGSVHL
jgi:hypothetical protein